MTSRLPESSWRREGRCRGLDPEIFFPGPDDPEAVAAAKAVCADCPVREPCLEYALALSIKYGVWGGWGEYERKRMRHQRALTRRRAGTGPPGRRDSTGPQHPVALPPSDPPYEGRA